MDTKPISVTKVNQAGSRFVILEMPEDKAAILILECEGSEWIRGLPIYMTEGALATLWEALSEFVPIWQEKRSFCG